jgi:hypothetical protein
MASGTHAVKYTWGLNWFGQVPSGGWLAIHFSSAISLAFLSVWTLQIFTDK